MKFKNEVIERIEGIQTQLDYMIKQLQMKQATAEDIITTTKRSSKSLNHIKELLTLESNSR